MRAFYVGYDPVAPEHDHSELFKTLGTLGARCVDSCVWLIRGEYECEQQLFDVLSPYTERDDLLVVDYADPDPALAEIPALRATA